VINIGPGSMSAPHKPDEWVTLEGLDQSERVLGPLLEDL
jgi:acetylornithine deacetylase/succinyl-diaminopimelate desuccinylase-like protein